ncbi:hypothetical protein QL093DRAFT_2522101 [Fusarium oxysporum]|nr:hypothetical protein QL093DRAFT_2522101 [Fusarium oxysporum]
MLPFLFLIINLLAPVRRSWFLSLPLYVVPILRALHNNHRPGRGASSANCPPPYIYLHTQQGHRLCTTCYTLIRIREAVL